MLRTAPVPGLQEVVSKCYLIYFLIEVIASVLIAQTFHLGILFVFKDMRRNGMERNDSKLFWEKDW